LDINMKIAIVHDDLIQYGGAERLLMAMHNIWPDAPIYTSFASKEWIKRASDLGIDLRVSWMQKLPFKKALFREYFIFYPFALESFNFGKYDAVLSSSTRFAHGVITRPKTLHIAYMNSPGRMFWEPHDYFTGWEKILHKPLTPFLSALRNWDFVASKRPDYIVANSTTPQKRIKKYYKREAKIIYPFVDLKKYRPKKPSGFKRLNEGKYFLVVSRLARWKRIDIVIEACNKLKLDLKIVGEGPDLGRLRRLAGPTVEVLGRLSDPQVVALYGGCKAFINPQEEDFGITPLEALASGRPVIAFKGGGALETLKEKKTGLFFYPQSTNALVEVLRNINKWKFNPRELRKYAEIYSKDRFKRELKTFVESKYELQSG